MGVGVTDVATLPRSTMQEHDTAGSQRSSKITTVPIGSMSFASRLPPVQGEIPSQQPRGRRFTAP